MPTPHRRKAGRLVIYALQAGAIVWRTIAMTSDLTERDGKMQNFAASP